MAAKRSPAYIMTEFPIIIVGSQRPDDPGKTPFLPHPSQPLPEGPWDATQKSAKHA